MPKGSEENAKTRKDEIAKKLPGVWLAPSAGPLVARPRFPIRVFVLSRFRVLHPSNPSARQLFRKRSKETGDRGGKAAGVDRLGDIAGASRCQRAGLVAGHRVRGERDDRDGLGARMSF